MSENENAGPPSPPPPPSDPPQAAPPPPPSSPPPPSPSGVSENRSIMIVLSYLWILALVPLLTEKDDPEVQWHAKHGIVLMVAEIAIWIVVGLLGTITGFLGCAFGPLLSLAFMVIHVVCIAKGLKGERFTLPVISEYADKF